MPQALGQELLRMTGVRVADEAWAESVSLVEGHLRMNIEVVDGQGKFLGEGRDLAELTARFAAASQAALAVPRTADAEKPVQAKAFSPVAQTTQQKIAGLSMTVYPALVDENGTVREGRFSTQAEAEFQHRRSRCCSCSRPQAAGLTELGLLYRELGRVEALVEDILLASLDSCILEGEHPLPREGAALAGLAERKRGSWAERRAPGPADAGSVEAVARPAEALQGQDRPQPGRGAE